MKLLYFDSFISTFFDFNPVARIWGAGFAQNHGI